MNIRQLAAVTAATCLLSLVASNASAVTCAAGVYRAGCAGPNGAVVTHRAPVVVAPARGAVVVHPAPAAVVVHPAPVVVHPAPVTCVRGVYRAGCVVR